MSAYYVFSSDGQGHVGTFCSDCVGQFEDDRDYEVIHDPYSGETDTPEHCDECGTFLDSRLTRDGILYVAEHAEGDLADGKEDSVALTDWLPFYYADIVDTIGRDKLKTDYGNLYDWLVADGTIDEEDE